MTRLNSLLPQLTMGDAYGQFREQLAKLTRALLDGFDLVVQVETPVRRAASPSSTASLTKCNSVLADKGFDRQTSRGRSGDDREVAEAAQGHVQGSWNRRGGHGQDVDLGAQCLDGVLLLDAKAMLFVDDQKAQVTKAEITLEQFVGADQNVDLARLCTRATMIPSRSLADLKRETTSTV